MLYLLLTYFEKGWTEGTRRTSDGGSSKEEEKEKEKEKEEEEEDEEKEEEEEEKDGFLNEVSKLPQDQTVSPFLLEIKTGR
ncbi:hypothetical protein M0804_006086 [Polistes exclamans]|nr:hypothetical protein M0804_006086 [Polistes exclamans]